MVQFPTISGAEELSCTLRPAFIEADLARITSLIRDHHFGLLITVGPRGMEASHIPFVLHEAADGFTLSGHLAAGNPQCTALTGGRALAIFGGPHAYVSPSWYRTQPAVPTWDYAAVHVSGGLTLVTDPAETAAMLDALATSDPAGFTLELDARRVPPPHARRHPRLPSHARPRRDAVEDEPEPQPGRP